MIHINDLDPQVLYYILCFATGGPAKDIDEWKQKLTLLHVCREWYGLLSGNVFSEGFIYVYSRRIANNRNNNLDSCVYYADDNIVCRSNLGIITEQDVYNCDSVSRLIIYTDYGLDIGLYGQVLNEIMMLGVGYWLGLTSLSIEVNNTFRYQHGPNELKPECLALLVSKHIHDFHNRIPNITHMELNCFGDKVIGPALSLLVNNYTASLKHLRIRFSIRSPMPQFPNKLASISLNLSNYGYQNPTFYARTLQHVELRLLSSSKFSWWIFHDFTTPGRIEFSDLKTLKLLYARQTDDERALSKKHSSQARPYGSHILQFPKVTSLSLIDLPVDCDVLFTDTMPTYLEQLIVSGDHHSVVATSRLRFTSVGRMEINVTGKEAPGDEFYKTADYYFGYTTIGSVCKAFFRPPIDIQRTVSWVNITELRLYRIEFEELLSLLPNLYKLRELDISNIGLGEGFIQIVQSGLEDEIQGDYELLDTRLDRLLLDRIEPENDLNLLGFLNYLLARATTLKAVKVSHRLHITVEKSFLPEKFQYVRFS